MRDLTGQRFRTAVVYWILLIYILAALVWWFISLNQQNDRMRELEIHQMNSVSPSLSSPAFIQSETEKIIMAHRKNKSKYFGEGSIFFLLILVGAGFVYRSVRRQFILQQQQQNFMMAVTHELKTPISVTQLNLETLQKHTLAAEKQQKILRNTLDETNRLNFLVNNILVSSQLEGSHHQVTREELDLSDLLHDRILDFRKRYPDRLFEPAIEQDVEIKGDSLHLQMLVNNLLENAIKYSPRETTVRIDLKKTGKQAVLQVRDEGPGIPETEKKKIFSKFYRIGNESTRKTQGTGLGLYLCRIIARQHNADISVTNNDPRGSNFAVSFKL